MLYEIKFHNKDLTGFYRVRAFSPGEAAGRLFDTVMVGEFSGSTMQIVAGHEWRGRRSLYETVLSAYHLELTVDSITSVRPSRTRPAGYGLAQIKEG